MAVITTPLSTRITVKLNNGTTESGGVKTVSVPFPSLNKDAFDADKVMAIVSKLSPVFSKSIHCIIKSDDTDLEAE